MEADPKQRSQRNRRRRRAAKMQQADRAAAASDPAVSGEEDDENRHQKPPRPPTRKKRNKEPLMEEDIIDGFAILSFRSYEELENTIKNSEHRRNNPAALLTPQHPNSQAKTDKCTAKIKNCTSPNHNDNKTTSHKINNLLNNNNNNNSINNNNNNNNSSTNANASSNPGGKVLVPTGQHRGEENGDHRPGEEDKESEERVKPCCPDGDLSDDDGRPLAALQQVTNGPLRQSQPCREHPLSDASSRCSSGRGYMCDSESDDDRGSDAGSDLFTAKAPKREATSPSNSSVNDPLSTPPVGTTVPSVVPAAPVAAATTNGPLTCRSPTPASAPTSVQTPLAIPSLIQNGPQHPPSSEPPLLGPLSSVPNGTAPSTTPPEAASASLTVVNPNVVGPLVPPPVVTPISSSSSSNSGNPPSPPHPISSSPVVVSHLFSPFQVEKPPLTLLAGTASGLSHPKSSNRNLLSSSPPPTLPHSRPQATAPLSFQPHLNHTTNHLFGGSIGSSSGSGGSSSSASKKSSSSSGRPSNLPPINSHTPPTGLPPPGLYSPLSPHPYQRTSPLLSSVPLKSSSSSSSSSSSFAPLQLSSSNVVVPPASSVITHSSTRPHSGGSLRVPSPAVVGAATTPTPSLGRDSSSSISSLSQLSQSLPSSSGSAHNNNTKDSNSSSGSSHSRSSSRNTTPCIIGPPPVSLGGASVPLATTTTNTTPCCTYSTATYGGSSSLTSLVLTKPPWVSSSANPILGSVTSPHLTPPLPPRPTPPSPNPSSLPLPPSLHNNHHSSSFGPSPVGSHLHPGAPHPGMFAAPMPPPSALTATNLSLSSTPTHYSEALFSQPNQDFLRRELDTRFLASQDRTIAIPPPPYMRTEMHQHQHTHMHQHSPFLPPHLSNALVPQPNPHLVRQQRKLYDKFPKLDSPFYGRSPLGIPTYPGLSPLLTPAGPAATATPFTPAGHLAAFQPKMNSLVKSKNLKMGRWCAMHVRIAWEIYHHQQKQHQQQSDAHKAAAAAAAAASSATGVPPGKSPADLLRPPGHIFPSLPRPHELGPLSSSLLAASAASSHSRTFDPSPHHNSFLTPNASHLGVPPFARPGYPGFGTPGSSFGGLGTLGLTGSSFFGNRDLRASCLGTMGSVQDPLYQMHHRTPPNFAPSTAGPPAVSAPHPPPPVIPLGGSGVPSASWGGLKVEAERERLQREEQEREREKQRKAELEKERREKELEKSRELERERERREHERQKERDRESRVHHHTQEIIRNGDLLSGGRDRERDWERSRERKEVSRSPHRSHQREHLPGKSDSAFESSQQPHPSAVVPPPHMLPKPDVKVKEERKEEVELITRDHSDRTRHDAHPEPADYLSRSLPSVSLGMSLTSLDRSRMMRSMPVMGAGPPERPPHSQVSPFWPPLPPPVPTSSAGNPVTNSAVEHYHRAMDFHHHHHHAAAIREQELPRYSLGPVIPPPHHRYRDPEFRHMVDMDRHLLGDRQVAYERSKLAPPPLRPNEGPGYPGPLGPASSAALFPPLASGVPHLNSLSGATIRNKSGSPLTGIPPPLIPCSGSSSVVNNHVSGVAGPGQRASPTLHHKLGLPASALLENEPFYAKDRRDLAAMHPSEVDSQSR